MKLLEWKNLKLVILVLVILIVTNLLTSVQVDRLSRKEVRAIKHQRDSLKLLFVQNEQKLKDEVAKRRKIFLEDSVLISQYKNYKQKDSILIAKQKKLLSKFNNSTVLQSLSKLDSAYEAEH